MSHYFDCEIIILVAEGTVPNACCYICKPCDVTQLTASDALLLAGVTTVIYFNTTVALIIFMMFQIMALLLGVNEVMIIF